ncbi:MAG: hypothetical protein FWF88_04740 [Peptococcaceae bacterium]|nr:hypothetical protein [Peptococcaceae bacterium]
MGLGLSIWFPVNHSDGTGKEYYQEYFAKISSVIPNWQTSCYFNDDGFRLRLVPFEEEVCGTWESDQLRIYAKTNSAGPGYHAYLVDILDRLGVSPTKIEDETGYYTNLDFGLLQNAMTQWLRHVSGQVVQLSASGQYSNIAISLTSNNVPDTPGHLTCCPLGYYETAFFAGAHAGDPRGTDFFIWWNKERDASFYKNTALNLLWCEVNWLPPETDQEKETVAAALACLAQAYALQPDGELPAASWLELARLAGDAALVRELHSRYGDTVETNQPAVGYNHGQISHYICGWRATFSGKMHFDCEEGGLVWWDDSRTIRAHSLSVEWQEGTPKSSTSLLRSALGDKDCEPFSLRNSAIAACVQHKLTKKEDGEPLHQTALTAAHGDELLFLVLYYKDPADRDWALGICNTVTR